MGAGEQPDLFRAAPAPPPPTRPAADERLNRADDLAKAVREYLAFTYLHTRRRMQRAMERYEEVRGKR